MTENELRQRVTARAVSLLGLKEADGSFLPVIETYNQIRPLPRGYRMQRSDPWCAAFVSAVGQMEGLSAVLLPECSCGRMISLYETRGLWQRGPGGRVRPGDLVFYNWDGDGSVDHVGLITAVDEGGCEAVEGNSSDAVCRRRFPKDWKYLAGFAFPDYAAAATEAGESGEKAEKPRNDGALTPPLLRRGMRGEGVLAMQGVLIARGCGCGPDGADGDFGANTEAALTEFQRRSGLAADGVCGISSWKKLLGVSA